MEAGFSRQITGNGSRLDADALACCHSGNSAVSNAQEQRTFRRPLLPVEFLWLMGRIRPLLRWHLASFLAISAGSLLALLSPLLLKWLIDSIIPQKRFGLLAAVVLLIFLGHEGRAVLTSIGSYLMLVASQKMGLALRIDLLEHLNILSADYYDETPVGAVMYPLKEPIDEIAYLGSDLLPAVLRLLLTTSFTMAGMAALSPTLTLAIVPLVPAFLIIRQHFRTKLTTAADTTQDRQLRWGSFLEEHLSSVTAIQLLGQEKRQERRAFRLLVCSMRAQLHVYRTANWFTISSSLAVVLAMTAVIGYGGRSVLAGTLSIGSLVAFYGFVTQLFDPLSGASELYSRAQKTVASIRQVRGALSLRPSVTNASCPLILSRQHSADIEFAGVGFGYSRKGYLLDVPTLRISAREHIAIAGENGAGKSTLVKLMVRIYDPISGSIRLGGEDLRNFYLKTLREFVSYLPRDPVLFDGSIESNLLFVRPGASEEEIEAAAQLVGLSPLLASLPNGLRQPIGPNGCQLSGGERQRLALARAALQKPQVLILDEATSCLDPLAEVKILQHLQSYLSLSTFVVISHRPSTFSEFGRVLLLSHGHIVEDGDPRTFLRDPFPSSSSMISTD